MDPKSVVVPEGKVLIVHLGRGFFVDRMLLRAEEPNVTLPGIGVFRLKSHQFFMDGASKKRALAQVSPIGGLTDVSFTAELAT